MVTAHRSSTILAAGIVAACLLAATPLLGQPRGRGQAAPRYDLSTETTVNGTVESVDQVTGPGGGRGRRGLGGTHIALRTGAAAIEVHLGPTAFMNEKKVAVAKGDVLEILGSRVTIDDEPVFLAKEVKKGDSVWTLRDAAGLPLWAGRGRR